MDKVFSHAVAHVSEPAHAQENILVPGKVTHAASEGLCMSVTRRTSPPVAGQRATPDLPSAR